MGRKPGLPTRRVDELFVFSEPVYKNGLTLLCDALDRLSKQAPHPLTITVAGPFGRLLGEHTGSMLLRRARRWPFKIAMHPKMNESECLAYLKAKSCIAIMPNYAANASLSVMSCLEEGIPFIATDVGGTKELLSKSDRGIALCAANPDALANKIKSIIGKKAKAARPMMARSDALKLWADQREAVGREVLAAKVPRQPAKDTPPPLVSVVMVHYDRPEYVLDAIAAVEQQDYPNFELILVDDGSKNKESLALLSKLAVRFRKQGWTLIRTKNRYLGAARNTGVLKARGEFILFVDDDNALFPNAISTFVRAMTSSGADVCTTLARYFHQGNIPSDQANGMIHYVPLGGSLDLDLISNTYGDANAMIRRSAFDRIGFQNEQYGYTAQDWEFFTRAALAGLKVRVIPEALYWYRSSVEGMFRSSNWYENRLPILAAFRKHNFAGLEYLYDLAISQNVDSGEKESLHYNLRYNVGDKKLSWLGKFDPNSSETLELLAEVAATEGRPDLAIMLLGHNQRPEFAKRTFQSLLPRSSTEQAAIELSADLAAETTLETELLREMLVRSSAPGNTPHLAYVEGPDRIYLEARDVAVTMAVLTGGCPIGTASVTASVKLDQELATPCEFILLVLPLDADPVAAASEASNESGGWLSLTRPFETSPLSVVLSAPSNQTMNLVLGVRCKSRRPGERALGCFSKISIRRSLGYGDVTRPRQGPPPLKQRARIISPDVLRKAELLAKFESSFPLVQFPKDEEGLFLRPSRSGAVAVNLPWAFPSFARGVVASVEVAHEDASPFEFSMLIKKPYAVVDWAGDIPTNFVAFSGWHRVERKFEIHKIEVKVDELSLEYMSLNVAVRLPPGSNPIPAQSFWRKLVLIWDS